MRIPISLSWRRRERADADPVRVRSRARRPPTAAGKGLVAAESCTCCASACLCVRAGSGAIGGQIKGRKRTKENADSRERACFSHPVRSERCFDVDLDQARSSLLLLALLSPRRTVHFSSVTVNLGHLWHDGEAINAAFTAALTAPPPPLSLPAAWRSAFASYRVAALQPKTQAQLQEVGGQRSLPVAQNICRLYGEVNDVTANRRESGAVLVFCAFAKIDLMTDGCTF